MAKASDVVVKALGEVGYFEKASNKDLDDFAANVGNENYTKYARDYAEWGIGDYQGQAWCDVFVDWCFVKAFGLAKAQELLGGFSAWTPQSAQNFKDRNRWSAEPSFGAVVFFQNSERINHTGIVSGVGGENFYTIEGNSDNRVRMKEYKKTDISIAGFGVPDYEPETEEIDIKNEVKEMYPALLGRIGTDSEVQSWVDWYHDGHTFREVYQGFLNSVEFRRKFISRMYREILGREGREEEIASWFEEIKNGITLEEVYNGFVNSEENKRKGDE